MTEYTKAQQAANRHMWVAALRSGNFDQTDGMLAARTTSSAALGWHASWPRAWAS